MVLQRQVQKLSELQRSGVSEDQALEDRMHAMEAEVTNLNKVRFSCIFVLAKSSEAGS